MNPECANNPAALPAGGDCNACGHAPHPQGPCGTCRLELRVARLELKAGLTAVMDDTPLTLDTP